MAKVSKKIVRKSPEEPVIEDDEEDLHDEEEFEEEDEEEEADEFEARYQPKPEHEEKSSSSYSMDVSIGAVLKDMLPHNPFEKRTTMILLAGLLMAWNFYAWIPPVLLFAGLILVWNLGHLAIKCVVKTLTWMGAEFADEER